MRWRARTGRHTGRIKVGDRRNLYLYRSPMLSFGRCDKDWVACGTSLSWRLRYKAGFRAALA